MAYSPTREWNYEGASPYGFVNIHGYGPTIIDTGDVNFPKAGRFLIDDGTRASWEDTSGANMRRNELAHGDPLVIGDPTDGLVQWWAGTTWFPTNLTAPTDNPDSGGWLFWHQFHSVDPSKAKPLVFTVITGSNPPRLGIATQGADFDLGTVPTDRADSLGNRIDWKMKILWHSTNGSSYISFWINNILKVDNQPCQTLVPGEDVYLKQGGYGNRWTSGTNPEPSLVLIHTGLRFGSTEESITVDSTVSSPGVPNTDLKDDFIIQDNSKWSYGAGTSVTSGQLVITPTASTTYPSVNNQVYGTRDLTGRAEVIELIQTPDPVGGASNCQFFIRSDTNSGYRFLWSNGQLIAQVRTASTTESSVATTYDATAHRWLRIRHSGTTATSGTVYFETSPDGLDWSAAPVATAANSKDLSNIYTYISAGWDNTSTAEPGSMKVDNYNLAPLGPTIRLRSADGMTWEKRKLLVRNSTNTGWDWGSS